jgi:putative protein-disulfide isomerase
MTSKHLTLDFFHDVVCGWCFNISSRLHALADEFDLDIRHRTFVLQASPAEMIVRFGPMENAKTEILGHWEACKAASDTPDAFNIKGMRAAPFDYPFGLPGALACKAAEIQAGQDAHWRMFDAIQKAHLTDARNIADREVLAEIAADIGLDVPRFVQTISADSTLSLVEIDRASARRLQVRSVPTIIVRETGYRFVNGPIEDLRAQLTANLRLVA